MLREGFHRFGFPVRAIQIDGGLEFQAAFEAACQGWRVRLFALPPRTPKLTWRVDAHTGHTEEFYDLVEIPGRS